MNLSKLKYNPFILFLPFLLFFLLIVLKLHTDRMQGDEARYYNSALNFIQIFLFRPAADLNLWSGPGYSIILTPFLFLKLPLISITMLNAVLQYLSIVFLFKTLIKFVSWNKAFFFSLFWACYYLYYQELPMVATETFALFLITMLAFCLVKAFEGRSVKYLVLGGFLMGYIALTKVIFGYVLLVFLMGSLVLWLLNRKSVNYKKSVLMAGISMLVCLPYLLYTYSLTGKVFYWSNSGGMSLYWMSTPFEGEFGDWNNPRFTANCGPKGTPCNKELFAANHQKYIDEVQKYKGVEGDAKYKEFAVANIKAHPVKYIKNWFANIGRLLFGFPNSYYYQSTNLLLRIPPNGIIVVLAIICLVPTVLHWRRLPYSIRFLLLFVILYLGASSLVSAYQRQFYIIVPVLLLWLAYVLQRTVKISFRSFYNREA
jgi:hypothetical protein